MITIKTLPAKWIICVFVLCFVTGNLLAQDYNDSVYGKTVKEIRITGLKRTKRYVVTRELASEAGKPYLKKNAEEDPIRLERLDLFSDIKIHPVEEEDGIILKVDLIETFPWLPTVSFQINDENGISAGCGFKALNLLGRDISFSSRVLFGGATTVEVVLDNPWFAGNHLSYRTEYYHRERDNELDDFYEKADELYLTLGSYVREKVRVGARFSYISLRSDSSGRTLSPDNHDRVARFGLYLGYDSRDSWTNTHTGWWNELEICREVKFLNSNSDYYELILDIRRFVPLAHRHTLALFSLTTLSTGTVGEDIAPWQDYHIGGTNSVRGWELGSRFGKNQFINTLEYRVTLMQPRLIILPFKINYNGGLQVALFGDLGVAWDENEQFKADNFIDGYGLGIRILLPIIGVARCDFGFGQAGESIMLHLGSYEKPVMQRRRVR